MSTTNLICRHWAVISRGDIEVVDVPASRIADEIGNPRSANMIMLGAFTKKSNLVSLSSLVDALTSTLKNKQKLIAINEKALKAGYDLV